MVNDLMHLIYGKKADVIYLRTLSQICEELDAINIVAGPVRLISMLSEKLFNTSKSLPAVMASGLHMVMKVRTLHTYDNRVNNAMRKVVEVAGRVYCHPVCG